MNTKTLIYSIIGIFVITTGAYIGISPIATRTLDAPVVENFEKDTEDDKDETDERDSEVSTTSEEVKTPEIKTTTVVKTTTVMPPLVVPTPAPIVTLAPVVTPSQPNPAVSGYSMSEVAVHSSESSCWSVVNGIVYDLTSYVSKHPGGSRNILKICGKDGSSMFEGQHGGDSKPEKILASYKIGPLK